MIPAPQIAAFHDLSGFGRCSLTVVLPVLAAMGCQCCPVPTAYLSAHTAFPASQTAAFLDLTDQIAPTAAHWAELGVQPDAIYSGFLGSARQIDLLVDFLAAFAQKRPIILVDPVMGDGGAPYRTYTPQMCAKMAELAGRADLITPNLTEAALLLGEEYDPCPGGAKLRVWLEKLSLDGERSVVVTGVSDAPGRVGAACLDRANGQFAQTMASAEPGHFPGTGDLFASVLLGALLRGHTLAEANAQAVQFTQRSVARTLELGTPPLEGVQYEGLLGLLTT